MKSSIFLNLKNSGQITNRFASLLSVLCFFLLLTLVACKKDKEADIIPVADTFLQMADDFVQKASLPVSIDAFSTENEIQDLFTEARKIIDEAVFIQTDADGVVQYHKVKDGVELSEAQKNAAAQELIDNNFIATGDYIVRANWTKTDGGSFFTLGVISADGKPKFEPILYFNGVYVDHVPNPMERGWDWNNFTHEVYNGFGMQVVYVEFNVHIATDPSNCAITDPAPHIQITTASANYPLWTQRTTSGEFYWCNPKDDCDCRHGSTQPAEECIKFVVVTYVASGFSDIQVTAGANGQLAGVELDAKITFNASTFGSTTTRQTIKNLCASGSTP